MLPEDFRFHSQEWATIREVLRAKIDTDLNSILNVSCTPEEANRIRGRVLFMREFLGEEEQAARRTFGYGPGQQ